MEDYKVYTPSQVINTDLKKGDIIGENSFVKDTVLGIHTQINRSNMIVSSSLGDYTYTGMNTVIKHTDIGRFCSISWNVSMAGSIHHYEWISTHPFVHLSSFGLTDTAEPLDIMRIKIGNDVWIGMNSCILPGVTVGDGAIIGAGSVVTRDVPDYAIVAGNPAKIIKYRFDDSIIEKLKEIRFWELDSELIRNKIGLFKQNVDLELLDSFL